MGKKCDYPYLDCPNMEKEDNTCLLRNPYNCPKLESDPELIGQELAEEAGIIHRSQGE